MAITRAGLVVALVLTVGVGAPRAQQPPSPQPSIGLPLPPIGLPLPTIGIPAPVEPPEKSRPHNPHDPPSTRPSIVILGAAPYAWGFEQWQRTPVPGVIPVDPAPLTHVPASAPPEADTGRLQIEVRPRDAQLFVNDEFVGTWSDLGGEIELPPGTHRIEIRARGFANHAFDARIVAGRTITYRAELTPSRGPAGTSPGAEASAPRGATAEPADIPSAPKPRTTFYLIPGCYLGNIPPEELKLPAGCDLRRLITHTPGQQ